ncbi:ABC transporter substrate-binding protein [Sinorhizobium sp. BJ1]|uniref:ABC transporter substrate-binding protein n=1 Tax=Sinorhizobium sp. BJ1 TaxID=2035455 RepID=UPI000BE7FB1F|nr:ABC transporter substrate-binding protein [Sinorhizobium sp. BJ1]PDT80832.1 branched-chain amino acid ABC transporter substrate-binding protein [Sinorhizobium sp. BJ1]
MHKITRRQALSLLAYSSTAIVTAGAMSRTAFAEDAAASSGDEIIIGAAVALTGVMSAFDVPPLRAAEFAVEDINNKGGLLGKKVRLIVSDIKSDPAQSSVAAQELLSEGAKLIITSSDFDFASGAAFVAQDLSVPAISPSAGAPQFGLEGIGRFAFGMASGSPALGYVLAEWAFDRGYKAPFILEDTWIEFNKNLCSNFTKRWVELAGEASIAGKDTFRNDDSSIASQVTKIKDTTAADFVVVCSQPPGGASAVKQIRDAGIELPILGADGFDGPAWLKAIPNLSNFYHVAVASIYGDDPKPEIQALVQRFKDKTGAPPPSSLAVLGYSTIEAYAEAVRRANTTDGTAVVDALEKFDKVPVLVGPTSFSNEAHMDLSRSIAVIEIKDGQPRLLEYHKPKVVPSIKINQ